jgi:hypothetical protein
MFALSKDNLDMFKYFRPSDTSDEDIVDSIWNETYSKQINMIKL